MKSVDYLNEKSSDRTTFAATVEFESESEFLSDATLDDADLLDETRLALDVETDAAVGIVDVADRQHGDKITFSYQLFRFAIADQTAVD